MTTPSDEFPKVWCDRCKREHTVYPPGYLHKKYVAQMAAGIAQEIDRRILADALSPKK